MTRRISHPCIAFLLTGLAAIAHAAPAERVRVTQRGDFLLIGNTLGYECAAGTPGPVVGTIATNACAQSNNNVNDSAPDLHWRSDSPSNGTATAAITNTPEQARSTAVLTVPAGATVTHAFLYWSASNVNAAADSEVLLERPGVFARTITAAQTYLSGVTNTYLGVADVTALILERGSGAYRLSGVSSASFTNVNNNALFAGWWMVVLYERPTDPLRYLAVHDGLDSVANGVPQNVTLSGFVVPNADFVGKLAVAAVEGDSTINGDQFFFNGGAALSDAQNPSNNFFNGTRSTLGAPVSVAGDLPQLTGGAQSHAGIDLDIVDVTQKLTAGQTSASVSATSTGDQYFLATFVVSLSTFLPNFQAASKTVVDLNGGDVLPGDVLEYRISLANEGNDTAVGLTLSDPLPRGASYVPGSLALTGGPNEGTKTDMPGDDQAEYSVATHTLTVRLGNGANAMQGGVLSIDERTALRYQVRVNAGATGLLSNQASITAMGLVGGSTVTFLTDGSPTTTGAAPTVVMVNACTSNAECAAPLPYCDTTKAPKVCVACLDDAHCSTLTPTCDLDTNACVCVATGAELCDGRDNDCNGVVDDGDPEGGEECTSGYPGICSAGVKTCRSGGLACAAGVQPETVAETCNGTDDDCDGELDEGFALGAVCTSGLGVCESEGTVVCDGPNNTRCEAPVLAGSDELCNGLDDDCDGAADEDFALLGAACTTGIGVCESIGAWTCNGVEAACNAPVLTGSDELCNGLDDDCDGETDEDFAQLGTACTIGLGECESLGAWACNGLEPVCNATVVTGSDERCNGLDDDCDGETDEDFAQLGTACTIGLGACASSGTWTCDGGDAVCNATVLTGSDERCNGLDDDCDGEADEDFAQLGTACTAGLGVCETEGHWVCDDAGAAVCDAVARDGVDEVCGNAADDDCDGQTDEDCTDAPPEASPESGGCSCGTSGASASALLFGLLGLARRRRRRE